ncbi:MAG: hypothetical protein IKF83_03615 [Clostridia bacterium]|nr:hypothetical protein [Clostridia bacterium]
MNFICIIAICFALIVLLAIIFKLNPKVSKQIAENKELNKLAEKYPSNLEICKDILKLLNNESVKIEEDKEAKDCVYIAITDKIIIAGSQTNFIRIQTIAHECIHSVQDKRIILFNFIFTNMCNLYFVIAIILSIFKLLPDKILILSMYILLGFVQFVVRAYLENDAMIKAKFLAKDYMQKANMSTDEEIEKIVDGFEQINNMGIKGYNFSLMLGNFMKVIVLAIVFQVTTLIFL